MTRKASTTGQPAATPESQSGEPVAAHPEANVPGPTANPATNLLMADILMRMGSYAVREGVQRAFLKGRYGTDTAKKIVSNRSMPRALAAMAIARLGTSSLPGAALVGAGMLAKALYERRQSRRRALAEGDAELIDSADNTPLIQPD